jgi:hypothetical protein
MTMHQYLKVALIAAVTLAVIVRIPAVSAVVLGK